MGQLGKHTHRHTFNLAFRVYPPLEDVVVLKGPRVV